MASVALDPAYRRISVEEFLAMDFGDAKAELEDGLIYMMAGGNRAHARIAANLMVALGARLRGSGCFPYGSDFAARTGERSIRYPDVSVYCDNPSARENDFEKLIGDPRIIFEVLSPSTEKHDERTKLPEYRELAGVQAIILINPRDETIRVVARLDGPNWADVTLDPGADLALEALNIVLPRTEIFSRD